MAEIDRVELVLDASTDEYERNMKEAEQATDDFGDAGAEAALKNMEQLAAMEAMTGGLNQVIGGYGKMGGAAQKLGLINEEQFKQFEKSRAAMELVAGPLEIAIALTKIHSASKMLSASAETTSTAAVTANTTAVVANNAAWYANPMVLIVVAILALIAALIVLEKKFGIVTKSVDALSDAFDNGVKKIKGLRDEADKLMSLLLMPITGPVGPIMMFLKEKHGAR